MEAGEEEGPSMEKEREDKETNNRLGEKKKEKGKKKKKGKYDS
jgi:hypothetical protein